MAESVHVARESEPVASDLSTEELEEALTLSAYDVHHVRGRRYRALLAERRSRRSQGTSHQKIERRSLADTAAD
jgi:hypothetical protein